MPCANLRLDEDIVYAPKKYRETEGTNRDKAKGIIAKPMPKEWHDWHSANKIEDEEKRSLYLEIVAEKKPYFMKYIYPDLKRKYDRYVKATNKKCMRCFRMDLDEMVTLPYSELTDEQRDFLRYYYSNFPVGNENCIMNQICHRFESEFDHHIYRHKKENTFDYKIMKSGVGYSKADYNAILKLYESYNTKLKSYAMFTNYEKIDKNEYFFEMLEMREDFIRRCSVICPDKKVLCEIALDICYTKNATKRFVWEICGSEIIQNLLEKNQNKISFPELDPDGNIHYCGQHFSVKSKEIGGNKEDI